MKSIKSQASSNTRKLFIDYSAMLVPIASYSIPAGIIFILMSCPWAGIQYASLILSPVIFSLLFALTAGVISLPCQDGIIAGKFKRDTGTVTYGKRRIYGTCWTTVYYCKPIYFLLLSNRYFKTMMFRLFGYKGNMDFTTYPDCWMRDLPLLDLKKNAYLSNRCTLGTNICHKDGTISVGKITVGENSIVGHLAMVALGASVGIDSEIGVGCCVGLNTKIGNNVTISPMSGIGHYALIGNNVSIGGKSVIGHGVVIADNIKIPAGVLIPDKARILTQQDVTKYISSTFLFNDDLNADNGLTRVA